MRTIAAAAAACGLIVLGGCGIGAAAAPAGSQAHRPPGRQAADGAANSAPAPAQAPAADHNKPAPQDSRP